jgi:DNA invertase Pin-like site-specific DNA recombinase
VIEAAKRGKVSAVLVWKIDRFARSALDLLVNIKTLQDAGCRFVAVSQGIDLSPKGDPISQLLVTVLAGVAEFERSIIRERTRMGVEKARRAGKHLGRPRSADAPEPAKVIELREKGLSWSRISEELECTPSAARRAACRKGSASGDVVTH